MTTHDLWHIAVLGSTLFAAAGLALLVLAPLLFDEEPLGLRRARPVVAVVALVAAGLLVLEWRGVH